MKKVRQLGDFSVFYDNTIKRHYWLLGYFGGGAVNISDAFEIAKEYSSEYNVPLNEVLIDEILVSRRYKHFKIMFSTKKQAFKGDDDVIKMDNVYSFLCD